MSSDQDPRLDEILEALLAFARHDFSKRAPVSGSDNIDAIATGLNMLAEELATTVASRKELEETNAKLVETGRMAAIGLLAAGVAHEVNNPAAWVSLALSLMQRSHVAIRKHVDSETPDLAAVRTELDTLSTLLADCLDGMKRITQVVGDLRTLSRASDESIESIDFESVVASCCRLASHHLETVKLVVEINDPPPFIANRGRVAQVVTNLVMNAAHAVTDLPDATIHIRVGPHKDGTLLVVEDNGPGIPEHLAKRVFDPFFTTKGTSEGMGLGLTIVARIAATYGGWTRVGTSTLDGGACIEVWFPHLSAVRK